MRSRKFHLNREQITFFLKRAAAKGMLKKIEEYLKNVPGIDLYNTEIEHIGENYDNVNNATGLAGLHKAVDLE
jgi:hypothetical protein